MNVKHHAFILAAGLLIVGLGAIAYQVFVQQVPMQRGETDPVWTIDAQVSFQALAHKPIKLRMFVPPLERGYTALNESFISNNYGVHVNQKDSNRVAVWSARRGSGVETLYYRLMVTPRFADEDKPTETGPQYRARPHLEGAEKVAANALLEPIRRKSADVETFVSETIHRVNDLDNDNVLLLLGGNPSPENRMRVTVLLLAEANIPAEVVHTIELTEGRGQSPELWLRTYNGDKWLYFNPTTGRQGLSKDRLVWWSGNHHLLDIQGGKDASAKLSVHKSELSALELAKTLHAQKQHSFINFSLYELPISTQHLMRVILMIPVGVILVLLIRSIIGIETLGTFTPVLIALAFRETQVVLGILLFTSITAIGLTVRSYLEYLKLQLLSRLSVMLTFVVLMMATISLLSYKLGLSTGLSVGLFPMVILTMTIERVSIVWEERGAGDSIKIAIATLITASICHLVMVLPVLVYWVFTFPTTLLILAAIMVVIGHYRGYRLSELVRFRELVEQGNHARY